MRVIADARLTHARSVVEGMRRDGGLDLTAELIFDGMTFVPWFVPNTGDAVAFTHREGPCVTHVLVMFLGTDMTTAQVKLLTPGTAEGWLFGPRHGGRAYDYVMNAAKQPVAETATA